MYLQWWILLLGAGILTSYSLVYLTEWKHPMYRQSGKVHTSKHYLQGLLKMSFSLVTGWLFACYLFALSSHIPGALQMLFPDHFLIRFTASFIVLDLLMYGWHRINHVFPKLWKFHRLHHGEKQLNVFSTFNFHPKEILFSTGWRLIMLPLIGIEPSALLFYNLAFFSVILFHHSNVRLNPSTDKLVEKMIVSPDMHHVHHSVIIEESNSNYGSVFSFWDRLFGTHRQAHKRPIVFGVE